MVGPSAIAVADNFPTPHELTVDEIQGIVDAFVQASRRSLDIGFRVIELHAAHGYLMHSFLSPISNNRQDEYGGSVERRMKFPLEVAKAVRKEVGEDIPLSMRISAVDGIEGGWSMDDSVTLAKALAEVGVDIVDCSSAVSYTHLTLPTTPYV